MCKRFVAVVLGVLTTLAVMLTGSAFAAGGGPGWSHSGVGAITQPAPVSGRFVFYAQHGGSLEVLALEASNGSTAWVAPASPSYLTPGVPAVLAVRDGLVFYLEGVGPASIGGARLVARNVATGKVVWKGPDGTFNSWPEICPDQTADVCVSGQVIAGYGELRFSAATGKLVAVVSMGSRSDPGRELGLDLFDPGARNPEKIVAVADGRLAWHRPVADIFTLPGASTDGGWDFDRNSRLGLFVGSVGTEPVVTKGRETVQLDRQMTAGFTISSGAVVWRTSGEYVCQVLPCPGDGLSGYTSPSSSSASVSVGVRVLETGTVSGGANLKTTVSPNATVVIQGFDPATGKTDWSYHAGHAVELIMGGSLPLIDADSIVLHVASGEVALNLRNGATTSLNPDTRAWCARTITYKLSHSQYWHGGSGGYVGQEALFPCTVNGASSPIPATIPSFIQNRGATAGGRVAWAEAGGVYAEPT